MAACPKRSIPGCPGSSAPFRQVLKCLGYTHAQMRHLKHHNQCHQMRQAPLWQSSWFCGHFCPCCGPKRRGCGSRISWRAFPAYPRRKARQRMAYHHPAGLALFWGQRQILPYRSFPRPAAGQGQVPEPVPALRAGRFFPAQPRNIPVPHMPGSFPPGLRAAEPGHSPGLAGWVPVPAAEPGQAVLPAGCCGASCGSGCGCAACCSARLG